MLCHASQSVDIEKERELERQARIEASLREREREVQKARSEQTKEIDREREQHKREEAIQHFKALMSDMVRCSIHYFFQHHSTSVFYLILLSLFIIHSLSLYPRCVRTQRRNTKH